MFYLKNKNICNNMTTHYDTLNISKDASKREIKASFKKLAMIHHPDKGGSKEKFQEIQNAYNILINDNTKAEYDDSLEGNNNLFDLFFKRNHHHQQQKGQDIRYELSLNLEDSYVGTIKKIKITRKIICCNCEGNGTPLPEHKITCTKCKGTGNISNLIHMGMMQMLQQQPCHFCKQKGFTISHENLCNKCSGTGTTNETKILEIPLRKGCNDGEIIVFQGMADEEVNIIPGDLLIHINIKEHKTYIRKNNDLYIKKELSLYDAIKGYDFIIKQLDGNNLRLKHSGITQPNTTTEVNNKGMPIVNSKEYGKLYITFSVKLPQNIPNNIIEMLKNYE